MKILFYLPVVTPWWFDAIIVPMLRALVREAELHVMIAPLWRNTGIDPDQLTPLADLEPVQWHIIHGDEHPLFRMDGLQISGLLDRVAAIQPDLTLCRSADFGTPACFPGAVRYLMEGAAPPFEMDPRCIILDKTPFAQGLLPPLDRVMREACMAAIAPAWNEAINRFDRAEQGDWRARLGLPMERPIVAVPLHYEHEENLFLSHAAHVDGLDLIDAMLAQTDPSITLAVTDHPLNRAHLDRQALQERIAAEPERLKLVEADDYPGGATALLARHADAMAQDLSKVWSLAAFFGTPLLRLGVAPSAPWLGAQSDLRVLPDAIRQKRLNCPDGSLAQLWFGWHLGTRVLDPSAADLDLSHLLALVNGTAAPDKVADRVAGLLCRELVQA
jgi:hypothetical protein